MLGRAATLALVILGSVMVAEASATTIQVPSNQPTIQAGIDAAADGDTVLVAPGAYVENIWIDHNVAVLSEAGPATTIIDGIAPSHPDTASVVRMSAGSIEGFDIRQGSGSRMPSAFSGRRGGGILIMDAVAPGPQIRGNWIHDNSVTSDQSAWGGGIWGDTPARVVSNRIYGNTIQSIGASLGAAVFLGAFENALLQDNEIFDNHVLSPFSESTSGAVHTEEATVVGNVIACNGGALGAGLIGKGQVDNNTVVANWSNAAPPEAAVLLFNATDLIVTFRSNTITHNLGPGLECRQRPIPPFITFVVKCNNIWGNFPGGQVIGDCEDAIGQDGNISVDPHYAEVGCPWVLGSGCLNEGSPLLPENSPPGCGLIGALGVCGPIGVRDAEVPTLQFQTLPARPNPFTERTTIPFYLAKPSEVQVWIYNVLGRRLRTLSPGWLFEGNHTLVWDGRDDDGVRAASGAYVARIRAGGQELTRTLLLVR